MKRNRERPDGRSHAVSSGTITTVTYTTKPVDYASSMRYLAVMFTLCLSIPETGQ